MSVRALLTAAVLLLLAMACCFPLAIHQTAESAGNPSAISNHAETETTATLYSKLTEHVTATIDSVDETTDQLYERIGRHSRTSRLCREVRQKVLAAMRREAEMAARWRVTLRKMTDGDYPYAQAVVESKKIDAESDAFLAELRAMVKEMQRIPGCHCGG